MTTTRSIIDTMHSAIPAPMMSIDNHDADPVGAQIDQRAESQGQDGQACYQHLVGSDLFGQDAAQRAEYELRDGGREHVEADHEGVGDAEKPPATLGVSRKNGSVWNSRNMQKPMNIAVTLASRTPRFRNMERRTMGP